MQLAVLIARFDAHQAAMESFRDEVRDGFDQVTERLDKKINGRLDEHAKMLTTQAVTLAELGNKVSNLNREVFERRPQQQHTTTTTTTTSDVEGIRISPRAIKVILTALGAGLLWLLTEWAPRVVGLGRGGTP